MNDDATQENAENIAKNRIDVLKYDKNQGGKLLAEIGSIEPVKIPIRLLSNSSTKTAQLLGNELEENHLAGKSRWHNFEFIEPLYIDRIEIFLNNSSPVDKYVVQTKWYDEKWDKKQSLNPNESGIVLINVKGLRKSIRFEPPSRYFSAYEITAVNIYGLTIEQLSEYTDHVNNVIEFQEKFNSTCDKEIEKVRIELERYEEALSNKEELKLLSSNLNKEIELSKKKITDDETRIAVLSGRETDISQKLERTEADIQQKKTELNAVLADITEKKTHLKTLTDDINMFPSEIKGYVSQGSKNVKHYLWLSAIPLAVVVTLCIRLILNAEDLIHFINDNSSASIVSVFVSRLPYVTVSIAILAMMVGVLTFLLTEIVNINRRKQELFKINIIATDIANTSAAVANIDEVEKMHYLNNLKMEMLRDHLKNTISDDFQIKFSPYSKKVRPNDLNELSGGGDKNNPVPLDDEEKTTE